MIHLDQDVIVAKIAKVREKVSDGDHEFDNIEDAMEDIPEGHQSEIVDSEEEIEDISSEEDMDSEEKNQESTEE